MVENILEKIIKKKIEKIVFDLSKKLYKELRDTAQVSIQGPKSEMVIKNIFSNSNALKFMEIGEYNYESFQYLITVEDDQHPK